MTKERIPRSSLYDNVMVTLIIMVSVILNEAEGATYGQSCGSKNLCTGFTMQCWGTCVCAVGYEHIADEEVCQEKNEVKNPDYLFSNVISLETNMTESDLDVETRNSIKAELKKQLYQLLKDVIGYKSVTVTSIKIVDGNLRANWTVAMDSASPSFANKTRQEAIALIRKDLKAVELIYKDTIFYISLPKTSEPADDSPRKSDDSLWIGLGIGLGCLVLVIIVVALVCVVQLRKRASRKDLTGDAVGKKSTVGARTISSKGGSSQLDGVDYQYSVFQKDDFKRPSYYNS